MQLSSPSFQTNTPLPADYTCKGRGVSPPLVISDVPASARSLVLIMHDPDAIGGRDFLHWMLWNIDPTITSVPEGGTPAGAIQGTNDYPKVGYGPACPPTGTGTHHYIFDLHALDARLDLPANTSRDVLESAMQGHILATAQIVGTVES